MSEHDMEQRTDAWREIRRGKVTASAIEDVMSSLKSGGEPAGRRNYRAQLVVEIMTGTVAESYTNGAMQWGIDNEDAARDAYAFQSGIEVEQVGFIDHPTVPMSGCSPDGLIGDDGMVEIKCPNTATHIDYLLDGVVPAAYVKQMQWQMACSGRKWNDFVSYDPRMPVELQLFVCRLERDDAMIEKMEDAVRAFRSEVDAMVAKLEALK